MSLNLEHLDVAQEAPEDDFQQYRALSGMAVASLGVGLLSAVALLDWMLTLVPIGGMLLGTLALRRIRTNPTEYTGEGLALAGTLLSAALLVASWSRLTYVYATEVPEGYQRISYDRLQPNEKVRDELFPPSAQKLDGKKVFIKGYVYQPSGGFTTGIKTFMLVRDRGQCCFGGEPRLTDMILVNLRPGLEATFDMRLRSVAGTFRVQPASAVDGLGGCIYHLDADHYQ